MGPFYVSNVKAGHAYKSGSVFAETVLSKAEERKSLHWYREETRKKDGMILVSNSIKLYLETIIIVLSVD